MLVRRVSVLGLAIADAPESASGLLPAMNPLTSRASKSCAIPRARVGDREIGSTELALSLEGRDPPEVVIPHLTDLTMDVKEPSLCSITPSSCPVLKGL